MMTLLAWARPHLPVWLRNQWGLLALSAALYVLIFAAWTQFHWGGEENISLISNLSFMPMSLLAAITALRVAAGPHDRKLRQAWLLIGLALFFYFLGDVIWFYLENLLQLPEEQLYPSVADISYLALFPLMFWGLYILSGRGTPLSRVDRYKVFLDLSIVIIAAWMLMWYFVISPVAADSEGVAQLVAVAYPMGDLAVIFGVLLVVVRGTDDATRAALGWLTLGALVFVATDVAYGYLDLQGLYSSGDLLDIGWVAAYVLFTLAALRQAYSPNEAAPTAPTDPLNSQRWTAVLPFLAIFFGYGLMVVIASQLVQLEPGVMGVLISVGALTIAVLGRQAVTLQDNLRLNAELRQFSAELEQRVEARTRELKQSQEALTASQKLASVGTMAAGIVHEVSNPLNTIISASELLEADMMNEAPNVEQIKLYVPIISRSAWNAARIMQALRTFSRGSNPELKPYSLNDIVQDSLLLSGFQLKRDGIALETDFAPDLPPVICDRNQIAQVIINLLNNARDAMPNGGAITVRTRLMLAGVSVQVADQGMGMTPEVLGKIFDPFYTTKEVGKGTGLGLSIVSGIIRAHKGDIRAYSDGPGKGAMFTVSLPIAGQ
jgi:signal transduction histidine kinase